MPMNSDIRLLNAAKKMDKDAIVKIFDLYASPLYKYALRLCGDPLLADHIVGDVFARLVDQLASGQGPRSNLRSYLYQSTYHRIVDEARYSQRRTPLDALVSHRQEAGSVHPRLDDPILLDTLLKAIEHNLTDDQRHVIILRFVEEFSLRETAAILGKATNHVKVIQSRALAKLRQVFVRGEARSAISLPRIDDLSNSLRT